MGSRTSERVVLEELGCETDQLDSVTFAGAVAAHRARQTVDRIVQFRGR